MVVYVVVDVVVVDVLTGLGSMWAGATSIERERDDERVHDYDHDHDHD